MTVSAAPVPSKVVVSALITRADGTIEDLGVVSASYRNPLRQLWWDQVGARLAARKANRLNGGRD